METSLSICRRIKPYGGLTKCGGMTLVKAVNGTTIRAAATRAFQALGTHTVLKQHTAGKWIP
jgi:hypothetical protein